VALELFSTKFYATDYTDECDGCEKYVRICLMNAKKFRQAKLLIYNFYYSRFLF